MSLGHVIANVEQARKMVSPHHIVKIIAVSKYVDTDAIERLYKQGQRAFGENKVQDLKAKSETLHELPLEWHHIGRIQTNKINELIRLQPFLVHGIDSLETAKEYHERLQRVGKTQNVLLQVNSAKEESKAGVMPEVALKVYEEILMQCPTLKLQGIMTIGAHSEENEMIAKSFHRAKEIFESVKPYGATILSMGMSSDYELAIANGANLIRVGSALFSGKQ